MPHKDGVAAVDRAISLLFAFDHDGTRSLSLTELSERTGLLKSTVIRIAASLLRGGFLRRGEDGRYRLGPAAIRLGARYQASFALDDVVGPVLRRVSDATGESASFYVREGNERICLHRVNSRHHRILHFVQVGTHLPVGTGASGRVIRAFTEPDAPDPERVRERLVTASTLDRRISETGAVAAPVFEVGESFVGSVGLAGPITRFGPDQLPGLERAVLEAARDVSVAMGGSADRFASALGKRTPEAKRRVAS